MNKPKFYKKIDKETRDKIWGLMRIAYTNNISGKKDPKKKLLYMLMIEFNARCFWCDIEVLDLKMTEGVIPDNMATKDHIMSRYLRKKGSQVLQVLCCNKCNQARALYDTQRYQKEHIKKLST